VDDGHRGVGELDARVLLGEARIVPVRDLAEEEAGERLRRQPEIGHRRLVGDHDRAEHRRDVLDAGGLRHLLVGHGGVGGAEVDRALGDLLDATAGADGLVVEANVGLQLVVVAEPLRVERVRKGRTGAGDEQRVGAGGARSCGREEGGRDQSLLHEISLSLSLGLWVAEGLGAERGVYVTEP
jgi:hypothetical protein